MTCSHLNRSNPPSCGCCPRSAQHSPILPLHLDLAFELAVGIRVARGATCNTSVGVEYARTIFPREILRTLFLLLDNLSGLGRQAGRCLHTLLSSFRCLSIYLHGCIFYVLPAYCNFRAGRMQWHRILSQYYK